MRTYRYRLARFRRPSPRAIRIGLFALGLILLIDIITVRFSPQVQSALTLPPIALGHSNSQLQVSTHTASTRPLVTATVVAKQSPVTTATVVPTTNTSALAAGVLAQDTFQRPDQQFWGTTSDGQPWSGDAAKAAVFSIVNHTGQVAQGSGIYDAVLGKPVMDSEVVFSGSVNRFAASNLGVLLRWTDANDLYKVFIDGTNLIALKDVKGTITVLRSVPFPAQDARAYSMRARLVGTSIMARVWPTGQAEPSTWMLIATDNALTSGRDGLRLIVQTGITITITSYVESKA